MIHFRTSQSRKVWTYRTAAAKVRMRLEYINNHLTRAFIKSFLHIMRKKKDDGETYNSPNYGYASILPLPLFSPTLITLTKTHKSERHTAHPSNTMHWGIPLNYPNTSQIQISPDIPVPPDPQLGCQKITARNSRPGSPPHYSPV